MNWIGNPERKTMPHGQLGSLDFSNLPFKPERVYWLSNTPMGETRGKHAHRRLEQCMLVLRGSCKIQVTDGNKTEEAFLSDNSEVLHIQAGLWRELSDFSKDALVCVIASEAYDEFDYIHEFEEFLEWKSSNV